MATPASRTVPSSPSPHAQGSSRTRDWSNLRTGEPGAAFRGVSQGRGSRGSGVRGGRGGGHPPTNSAANGGSHPNTLNSSPSLSPPVPSPSHKLPVPASTIGMPNNPSDNGFAERGGRRKSGPRKPSRGAPVVTVAPASPPKTQTAPPTPSRSAHRQRRPQSGKGPSATAKSLPLPNPIKLQNPRVGSTLSSQAVLHKDIPPYLSAAHEAEIRHDIDVLVERVRAVAMAENRPTTPGSHIDWAGAEDDSLPDLDDWGVTTTHTNTTRGEDQSKRISPILADTLKSLPEPDSDVHQEEEREMDSYAVEPEQVQESPPVIPPFTPSPTKGMTIVPPIAETPAERPTAVGESSSPILSVGKLPLHPSLPSKPVGAMESLRVRGGSISKPSERPSKPLVEEALTTKTEGLPDERLTSENVSSTSSSERGLAIHASVHGLPESHSAPNLLSAHSLSAGSCTHSRSRTEGRPIHQAHTAPPGMTSHRHGQPSASSPLGKYVYSHSRNHSTPAGGAGSRLPQASRPVITGEAISRLARTIGGLGSTSRTQTIPVIKDSTISS